MEQTILSSAQRIVVSAVAQTPELSGFYLSGGTALAAYYLQHRYSDDLDFFTPNSCNNIFLHAFAQDLKEKIGARGVRYERLYDRNQYFFWIDKEELKIEFTTYPFKQFEEPSTYNGFRVDSMRDITANKLMALLDRFDPKDFVDLYFLFQQSSLGIIRHDTEGKFGIKIGDVFLGGELAKVRRIEALPRMLKPVSITELKTFFTAQAQTLRDNILE